MGRLANSHTPRFARPAPGPLSSFKGDEARPVVFLSNAIGRLNFASALRLTIEEIVRGVPATAGEFDPAPHPFVCSV